MSSRGIDVSNYSGIPTLEAVRQAVNALNLTDILIACQFPDTWKPWYEIAEELGLRIQAWIYLYNDGRGAYSEQTRKALNTISGTNTYRLWLDVEDPNPPSDLEAQLRAAIATCGGFPSGIYSAAWYWDGLPNPPQLADVAPLWDATWDGVGDISSVSYGGWHRPKAKQYYSGLQIAGLNLDLDVLELG